MDAFLERMPVWGYFVAALTILPLSIRLGILIGAQHRRRAGDKPDPPAGPIVGAIMGLLAFILAITFGGALSRFEARKQLLIDDVEAISTAARRAELLPEPTRTESLALLRRYVELRIEFVERPREARRWLAESESIQRRLWDGAVALVRAGSTFEARAYLESMNRVMVVHMRRATVALQYRIPGVIWLGLLIIAVCAMTIVGYQLGLSGRVSWIINAGMATAFASVILIIALLDRTGQGGIHVNQQPMLELRQKLSASETLPGS